MSIKVRYFAGLKDSAGKSEEELDLSMPLTAKDLYSQLAEKYGFQLGMEHLRVAVNDEFTSFDHQLNANDLVVFIPPVAGG